MKTPILTTRVSSLLLTMAFASITLAQNESGPAPVSKTNISRSLNKPLAPSQLSAWTGEMVRLAQSGIDESVMLAFVGNSGTFDLAADHIIYLNELGVSGQVISAMLRHDQKLASSHSPGIIAGQLPTPTTDEKTKTQNDTENSTLVGLADATSIVPAFEVGSNILEAQTVVLLTVVSKPAENVIPSAEIELRPAPQKRLYPVREPYPVELTAPIVFLDSPRF